MNEKFTKYGIKIYNRPLDEATRNDLISKSKQSGKGQQRFKRRVKSSVSHNVRQYNQIDMNKLFKQDILTVNIQVNGETDDYVVKISFGGFLEILQDELKRNNDRLDLRTITRALLTGFNKGNVYINCNCPDFFYRFGYYATKNQFDNYALTGKKTKWKDKNPGKINYSGVSDPQLIPSNITNPNDTLGSACKHVLLVLSNTNWMIKVASVINNYIRYMSTAAQYRKVYADVIYPAVYGKPYEEPVQLAFGDRNYAPSSKKFLNKANTYQGRDTGGKFTKGNEYEIKPSDRQAENDITLFDNDTID